MREFWRVVQVCITLIGGYLGMFIGGFDGPILTLVIFVCIDYITGVMCGLFDRKLSSEVGFKGICRKVIIFLLVGVAHMIDKYVIGSGDVLRTATIFFYLSNEGISILENSAHLGLPIPEKLKRALEQIHDRSEGEGV